MKKTTKCIISLLLVLTIVSSLLIPAFSAEIDRSENPIIYLEGQGNALYINPNTPEEQQVYPIVMEEDYIMSKVKEHFPTFAKAFFTQQWGDFCDVLYESMAPLYDDVRLDGSGSPSNGSTTAWTWSRETLTDTARGGTYGLKDYSYHYDWRLDPIEIAADIHDYIEAVLEVTGCDSVSMVGRCLGANLIAAYLSVYDGEYVDSCVLYCGAMNGAVCCSKPFCGEFVIDGDSIERFTRDKALIDDLYLNEFLTAFISVLNRTYGLDLAEAAVLNVYEDIYLDITPRILRASYATFPSYWSMVSAEDYQKAKETVFHGVDPAEYAGLINKIDNYHQNVMLTLDEKLVELDERGVDIAIIAKYGYQTVPLVKDCELIGDGIVTVEESSIGATTVKVGETFSRKYLENAEANGTAKYISPDREIDASTCILPDSTWFVKNSYHTYFPEAIDKLIMRIVVTDDMSIDDFEEFPQYLLYIDDSDDLAPLTEENMNCTERWNTNLFREIAAMFSALYHILVNYIRDAIAN